MPVVEEISMSTVTPIEELQQIRDFPTLEILLCIVSLCFIVLILVLLGLIEILQFRRSRNADYQVNPEPQPQNASAAAPPQSSIPQSKDEHF